MNQWTLAALVLLVLGLIPIGAAMLIADVMSAAAAFSLAGPVCSLILLLLAEGFHRQPFVDLAIVLAAVNTGGSLVLARLLEWGA
jgi:hypothetical protein